MRKELWLACGKSLAIIVEQASLLSVLFRVFVGMNLRCNEIVFAASAKSGFACEPQRLQACCKAAGFSENRSR